VQRRDLLTGGRSSPQPPVEDSKLLPCNTFVRNGRQRSHPDDDHAGDSRPTIQSTSMESSPLTGAIDAPAADAAGPSPPPAMLPTVSHRQQPAEAFQAAVLRRITRSGPPHDSRWLAGTTRVRSGCSTGEATRPASHLGEDWCHQAGVLPGNALHRAPRISTRTRLPNTKRQGLGDQTHPDAPAVSPWEPSHGKTHLLSCQHLSVSGRPALPLLPCPPRHLGPRPEQGSARPRPAPPVHGEPRTTTSP
jgi:hypothetical protein